MLKRHRGLTPEMHRIIALRESGLSWSEVAVEMGLGRDACCVLYGRAVKELANRASLEKTAADYEKESRRSPYVKVRRKALRKLKQAQFLDGVPMKHRQRRPQPQQPVQPRSEPPVLPRPEQPQQPRSEPRSVYMFYSGTCYEEAAAGGAVVEVDEVRSVDSKGQPVRIIRVVSRPRGMAAPNGWMYEDGGVWRDLYTKKPLANVGGVFQEV